MNNVHAERQGAATSVAYKQRHRIVHYMGYIERNPLALFPKLA